MSTLLPLPGFALLFTDVDEQSRLFLASPDAYRLTEAATTAWRIDAYQQHEDSAWRRDAVLVARDDQYACAGAIDLLAGGADGRQQVIAAYQHYGADFLAHIDGEFAFALADADNETIILARDRLGLQSLYYATDGESLAVANNLAGISHLLRREPAINAEYMFDFLARNVPKPDHSIYHGIHMLPPGHFLVFRQGAARVTPYWRLATTSKGMATPADPVAGLRQMMAVAIKRRLPVTGKIVVQLSGGLDSSALLGFLTEIAGNDRLVAVTRAFAAAHQDEWRDELTYAQDAARHCGVPLLIVDEEVTNPLPALEEYFQRLGNFSPNPYYDIGSPLHRRMQNVGDGVVFTGFGGDEGVSLPGDIALPQLFLAGRWLALRRTLGEISTASGHARWKLFRHWLLPKLPPPWLDDCIEEWRMPENFRLQRLVLLREEARRAAGGGNKKHQSRPQRTIAREIRAGVLGPLFVQTSEVNQFFSWRHGLRFFHPFLDKDVLTYAVSLPPASFLMDGWKRGLFRRAIAGYVPESILTRRTKSPFSLPFPIYIRAAREMIMDMCHTANHPAWDYLDQRALAFFTRRVCREEISHPVELAAVAVGNTAAMAMFLANRHRYWRQKGTAAR